MKVRFDKNKAAILANRKGYYHKRQLKIKDGLCVSTSNCTEPLVGKTRFCLKHWLIIVANSKRRKNDTNRNRCKWTELLLLWNQQKGLCAITGVVLTPGINAELDHIVPVSRNGTNHISNLRFVHESINQMKGSKLDSEFKEVCRSLIQGLTNWTNS